MSMNDGTGVITLRPGVTISPGRETVQTGSSNQPVQGMIFTLTLANGATTSVFVPYAIMTQTDVVSQMFAQRVAAINAVSGLGG